MTYKEILEKITKDFLLDLSSFRVQLVYMAYIFNFSVLYGVIFKHIDYKALGISFALLTALYAFYFRSKEKQNG